MKKTREAGILSLSRFYFPLHNVSPAWSKVKKAGTDVPASALTVNLYFCVWQLNLRKFSKYKYPSLKTFFRVFLCKLILFNFKFTADQKSVWLLFKTNILTILIFHSPSSFSRWFFLRSTFCLYDCSWILKASEICRARPIYRPVMIFQTLKVFCLFDFPVQTSIISYWDTLLFLNILVCGIMLSVL